jgi:hypothetical protein
MDVPTLPDILSRIEAFCERHDMAESRFGREAVNNPALVGSLRGGGNPTLETLQRIADFIAARDAEREASEGERNAA